jgi:hypothetical protein
MEFEGAVIKEQGITFGVVVVKPNVLSNSGEADRLIACFEPILGVRPVVLMAQDRTGTPSFYGRHDVATFMAKVPVAGVRWRRFTVN